jgi:hypothetical protein
MQPAARRALDNRAPTRYGDRGGQAAEHLVRLAGGDARRRLAAVVYAEQPLTSYSGLMVLIL